MGPVQILAGARGSDNLAPDPRPVSAVIEAAATLHRILTILGFLSQELTAWCQQNLCMLFPNLEIESSDFKLIWLHWESVIDLIWKDGQDLPLQECPVTTLESNLTTTAAYIAQWRKKNPRGAYYGNETLKNDDESAPVDTATRLFRRIFRLFSRPHVQSGLGRPRRGEIPVDQPAPETLPDPRRPRRGQPTDVPDPPVQHRVPSDPHRRTSRVASRSNTSSSLSTSLETTKPSSGFSASESLPDIEHPGTVDSSDESPVVIQESAPPSDDDDDGDTGDATVTDPASSNIPGAAPTLQLPRKRGNRGQTKSTKDLDYFFPARTLSKEQQDPNMKCNSCRLCK
ncbi:hypothetical protein C8J56DRAFT_897343 [Mycena floridula]|nr:hypothetical protein C8J56DRAFT_897343 [Mycena floridula]